MDLDLLDDFIEYDIQNQQVIKGLERRIHHLEARLEQKERDEGYLRDILNGYQNEVALLEERLHQLTTALYYISDESVRTLQTYGSMDDE